jgi:hypothetical protein
MFRSVQVSLVPELNEGASLADGEGEGETPGCWELAVALVREASFSVAQATRIAAPRTSRTMR